MDSRENKISGMKLKTSVKVAISLLFIIPMIVMIIYIISTGGFAFTDYENRAPTAEEIGGNAKMYINDEEEYRACQSVGGDGNRYYWDITPCTLGDIKLPKLAQNGRSSICCINIK